MNQIRQEEEDKIVDLTDFAKTSVTINKDPNRFTCILNHTCLKQANPKRNYLKALPEHVKEADKKLEVTERVYPPRRYDAAIDEDQKKKAEHKNFQFQSIFGDIQHKKQDHLNRMSTS